MYFCFVLDLRNVIRNYGKGVMGPEHDKSTPNEKNNRSESQPGLTPDRARINRQWLSF
jgi:hypothetical protein